MRRSTRIVAALAITALAVGIAPTSVPAATKQHKPTRAAAEAALGKVKRLSHGKGVRTGYELSPALAQLAGALPSLSADDRQEAEAILARPDKPGQDPPDTHKWAPFPEAANSPACRPNGHFCIHWPTAGSPDAPSLTDTSGNGIPDYVDEMLAMLEDQIYPCENGTAAAACSGKPGLDWRTPASDGSLGGDSKVDVYIEDLFSNEKVFGYVAIDPGQAQDPAVPHFGYMVLDKDYSRFANGDAVKGRQEEQVTAAHEYNHILQNAYDYLQDPWMFEATAVYIEDKVYSDINDYLQYIPPWTSNPGQPLTTFSSQNLKPYGSAVWNHWLDFRFGPAVVRAAWEGSVAAQNFAPGAYSTAISSLGGAGFADEFDRFAAAVAEWNVPGSGFPDKYPEVPRSALLPAGTQTVPFALPHTTFALFDVPVPALNVPVIRLTVSLPAGTAGGVALVGRTGADPSGGAVTSNVTPMPNGGTAAVQLDNPGTFGRITAVVANSDTSRAGFDPNTDDYIFTRDAQNVVASMIQAGPPLPVTGTATVTDHTATISGTVDPQLIDSFASVEFGPTLAYGSSSAPTPVAGSTVGTAPVTATLTNLKANTTYHYRVLGTNPAGVGSGLDMTFRTARDTRRPTVTVKVARQKLRTARTRGAVYSLRCSERCLGTTEVRLSRGAARALGLKTVVGKARVVLDAKPTLKQLRVRLTRAAKQKLAGRRTSLTASLRVAVADESRNKRTVVRRVVFRP